MVRFVGCLIEESLADPRVVADWAPIAASGAPVMTPFGPQWQEWDSLAYNDEDFPAIGAAYLEEATESDVRRFKVGSADALLMRLRPLVDFATDWMRSRIG